MKHVSQLGIPMVSIVLVLVAPLNPPWTIPVLCFSNPGVFVKVRRRITYILWSWGNSFVLLFDKSLECVQYLGHQSYRAA